jgi:hypothetical protein
MALILIAAAVCLLAGLLFISISLYDLDKGLLDLSRAMDERYGSWMARAESRKQAVKDKSQGAAARPTGSPGAAAKG